MNIQKHLINKKLVLDVRIYSIQVFTTNQPETLNNLKEQTNLAEFV